MPDVDQTAKVVAALARADLGTLGDLATDKVYADYIGLPRKSSTQGRQISSMLTVGSPCPSLIRS